MEFTGNFIGLSRDWKSNKWQITLSVNEPNAVNEIDNIKDCEKLSVKAVKYRKKRSLDANSYYWLVLTKIAAIQKISLPYAHNYFLRRYGQLFMVDGKAVYTVLPDTEEAEKKIDESETFHLKPTSQVKAGKDGINYRTYMMLKGSSEYDTKEMSVLIDGIVTEAKELGIETLPDEELRRIKEMWGVKNE